MRSSCRTRARTRTAPSVSTSRRSPRTPRTARILTKYAAFLKSVRGDHEQAERLFLRAIEASPENADSLGSYAVFVHSIQHDEQKAQAFYERAVKADPFACE